MRRDCDLFTFRACAAPCGRETQAVRARKRDNHENSMKWIKSFLFVWILLGMSTPSRGDDAGLIEGYTPIGPFPLGKLITVGRNLDKPFSGRGAPTLREVAKALDESQVYIVLKKERNKAGELRFGQPAALAFDGRLHFDFKSKQITRLEIDFHLVALGGSDLDYTTTPPTSKSWVHFVAHSKEILPFNVLEESTDNFAADSFRFNLDGRLLDSPVKPVPPRARSLMGQIAPLVKAYKGKVALAVKHLGTSEVFLFNADEVMPTASLIKLPVMIEVYQQASSSRFDLKDMLTLRDKDKVPGSGILTYHFSEGATFSIRDAVRLMIAYSDNTATNMLLDKIGIAATGEHMEKWGFPNTKINAKVFLGKTTSIDPEGTKKYGLGSTTAREMVGILEKLYQGKFVSPDTCKQMIEHLKNCQFKDQIKRFLPAETVVAHKTGAVSGIRTDAGIMYLKSGPVALCILTADNADKRWSPDNEGNVLCGRVAKEVYDYFETRTAPK
jgi:beta-lactamase class A